jgi:hypothetical protein
MLYPQNGDCQPKPHPPIELASLDTHRFREFGVISDRAYTRRQVQARPQAHRGPSSVRFSDWLSLAVRVTSLRMIVLDEALPSWRSVTQTP